MQAQLYIGGEFRPASDGGTYTAIDPATGAAIADVALATADDASAAVGAARAAFDAGEWSSTPAAARGGVLRAVAAGIKARAGELAELEVRDAGATVAKARGDVA